MDKKQMEMLSVKSAVERMVHNYISTYKTLMQAQSANRHALLDDVKRMMSSFYTGRQVDNWTLTDERNSIDIAFEVRGHKTLLTFLLPPELKLADPTRPDYDPRAPTEVFYSTLEKPMHVHDKMENKVHAESDEKSDDQKWDEYLQSALKLKNIPEAPKKEQKFWDGEQWLSESELFKQTVNEQHKKNTVGEVFYDTKNQCTKVFDGEKWIEMTTDYLREHATNETNIRVSSSGSLEMFKNGKWVQLPKSNGATPSVGTQTADSVSEPKVEDEFDPFEAYERAKKAVRNMG